MEVASRYSVSSRSLSCSIMLNPSNQIDWEHIWEIIKLSAVLVDAIAASYFLYFVVIRGKVCGFKADDHEHHAHSDLESVTHVKVNTGLRVEEETALMRNSHTP